MAERSRRSVAGRPAVALAVLVAVGALVGLTGPARAGPAREAPASAVGHAAPRSTVERVLVVSLPRLTWADVVAVRPANLLGLLDRSAVASAATRSIGSRTSLAEGYLTIGAGNRAAVHARDGALAFAPDEPYGTATAGEEYRRRTGRAPGADVVQVAVDAIDATNEHYRYGTEPGALGDALNEAGWTTAVIGNADTGLDAWEATTGPDSGPRTASHREPANILADDPADAATAGRVERPVALGLMSADGLVDGDVSHRLLTGAPDEPFGVTLDEGRVLDAFDRAWRSHAAVLVEMSDLDRADAGGAGDGRSTVLRRRALVDADRRLGRLLDRVDDDDLVVVVAPAAPRAAEEPTPFAMAGPGITPGITDSGTTRRSGYVTLTDVAPTILTRLGLDDRDSMSGARISGDGGGATGLARYRSLAERNEVTAFRDHAAGPISIYYLVIQITAWCLAALSFLLPFPALRWLRPLSHFGLLVSLAFPTVAFLFGLRRLDGLGRPGYAVALTAVAVVLALGAELTRNLSVPLARWPLLGPPVVLVALLWLVLIVDGVTGARLQIDTVFGYSPVVAGRFAGYGNLAFALLAMSAMILATASWALVPDDRREAWRSRGLAVATTILVVTVLVDGFPAFGSDIGGVLCLVPASAVALVLLSGRRPRGSTIVVASLVIVMAFAAFAAYDLSRPAAEQSHLGRFVDAITGSGDGGTGSTMRRKADAAWATLRDTAFMWVVPMAAVALVVAIVRRWGFVGRLIERIPGMLACLWGSVVLGVLGGVLNDSGVWVPAMMGPIFLGYILSIVVAPAGADDARSADTSAGVSSVSVGPIP